MLFGFLMLGLVSPVPSQEIGWEERLQNDLFCQVGLLLLGHGPASLLQPASTTV